MFIQIIVIHRLGFTYSLKTQLSARFSELDAYAAAIQTASIHFGLLPAPLDFKVEVIK